MGALESYGIGYRNSLATVIDIGTRKPISPRDISSSSIVETDTISVSEQIRFQSITSMIGMLMENGFLDKNWGGYASNPVKGDSLIMLVNQLCSFNARIPVPDFTVEPSGIMSMSWYGNNGSFILAFNGETREKEYSLVCRNGDTGYGTLHQVKDVMYYIDKINDTEEV